MGVAFLAEPLFSYRHFGGENFELEVGPIDSGSHICSSASREGGGDPTGDDQPGDSDDPSDNEGDGSGSTTRQHTTKTRSGSSTATSATGGTSSTGTASRTASGSKASSTLSPNVDPSNDQAKHSSFNKGSIVGIILALRKL